ncbi:MAG TPA: phosphate regulon sensor histidine kinase PhoR [Ramlibacter sp.]|nr:phosphate regulon sensor histidine kinase PhoR [Ramlibacter sp.]
MTWRITSFLLFLLAGLAVGTAMAGALGGEVGVTLAAVSWFVGDLLRGLRVARWLRRADNADSPQLRGLWGEVAERTRRALRAREQQTNQAEARLQDFLAAIQASPNGVVLLDVRGHIEWCNQTAAEHFGLDAERDRMQLVGNLLRDPAFTAYNASGKYDEDIVVTGRRAVGSAPARISVRLHPYGEGRKLLLSRDVTALEQAETMRRDFVANVSHEIRTPLTVLTGFVETLQSLPLEQAERARYLALMAQQARRMQSLVDDLLTLSRLEGSPAPGMAECNSMEALVAQCESDARALSQLLGRAHVLRFDPAPAHVQVACAHNEILSAMSNLVSNAIRYTPAGGAIHTRWRLMPGGGAEFSVRDEGPGIAPEHISRLTERFYRVDRSRSRETGGTGLGLAIVKHVVQRHGGELRIESAPGAGSLFAFTLPPSRVRAAAAGAVNAAGQPATAGS